MSAPLLETALRVLRGEGMLAVRDRALDRLAETRRRRSFPGARRGWRADCPVLSVSAYPPAPRFGGVQAQWLARLTAEEALGPVALLYPLAGAARDGGYRLEMSSGPGGERRSLHLPGRPPARRALRDPDFEAAVSWAVERVGARVLEVEGAAGLPPASLLQLTREGLPLVLALHDFALFCPRPHLLEEPARRFCGYCRDLDRCAACLGEAPGAPGPLAGGRRGAPRRRPCRRLPLGVPGAGPRRVLRRPARRPPHPSPGSADARSTPGSGGRGADPHLALVGGLQTHKGGEVFLQILEQLRGTDRTGSVTWSVTWSVYGGGDPALLARLRGQPGVRVRGYYRAGTLPGLLRRDGVDLALLPSIVPESFSLVLSECRAAGVPVVAFDLGAVGERLRAQGGGLVVPPAAGAAGMAAALADVLRAGVESLPPLAATAASAASASPEPEEIARRWLGLYRELGLL